MAESYFPIFKTDHVLAQTPDFAKSFGIQESDVRSRVELNLDSALPNRERTKDNFLYEIRDVSGKKVGHLWLSVREFINRRSLFISDIFVEPTFRGQGIGKQLLAWVEGEAKRLGFAEVTLHVFGSNVSARRLYEQLGFLPTSIHMSKRIY